MLMGIGTRGSYLQGLGIWSIIALVLAIVGAILVYVLFLSKKNEDKVKGFWKWLYHSLKFDKMMIEVIIKILYLFGAIFITLYSFGLIGVSFVSFLITLVIGNVALRITFELLLITLQIWKNTTEINQKMKK